MINSILSPKCQRWPYGGCSSASAYAVCCQLYVCGFEYGGWKTEVYQQLLTAYHQAIRYYASSPRSSQQKGSYRYNNAAYFFQSIRYLRGLLHLASYVWIKLFVDLYKTLFHDTGINTQHYTTSIFITGSIAHSAKRQYLGRRFWPILHVKFHPHQGRISCVQPPKLNILRTFYHISKYKRLQGAYLLRDFDEISVNCMSSQDA